MLYAKISNGQVAAYPYSPASLRRDNPNVSFPAAITDEILAQHGVLPVAPAPKPTPNWFERVEELFPVKVGGVWTQKWQTVAIPNDERPALIAASKTAKLAALARKRWEKEKGGITFNGANVSTDEVSQTKIIGAVVGAQMDPTASMKWKMKDGSFVTLDATAIIGVAMAVRAHVQACFDREAELRAEIEGASNPDAVAAIDIEAGWPT